MNHPTREAKPGKLSVGCMPDGKGETHPSEDLNYKVLLGGYWVGDLKTQGILHKRRGTTKIWFDDKGGFESGTE